MNFSRPGSPANARIPHVHLRLSLVLLGGMVAWLSLPTPGAAYDQYSLTRTAGNCAACHGGFRVTNYISKNDNVAWNTSLHDGHRQTMLGGDCSTCHFSSRFPVSLDQSDGGTGLSPIGCAGCHGRAEPGAGNAVKGSGLRQHHDRNGVTVCRDCHTDANPATFTTAAETVAPPYYFTPDAAHPGKPTQSCNGNGSESRLAGPLGLDNDGNNVYDAADGACNPSGVADERPGGPALQLSVAGPLAGGLRVSFVLPTGDPARLEAFDVVGRIVARREVGELGPGAHAIDLSTGPAASGWYLLRLSQGGRAVTVKAIVVN